MLSRLFTCPALPRLAHLLQSDRLPTQRECWGGAVHAGGCGPPTDCSASCVLFCGSNACQSCCDACAELRAVLVPVLVPARCGRTCSLACCCCAPRPPACLHLLTKLPSAGLGSSFFLRSETYQYFNLPFCHPKEGKEYKPEGLGEVLEGDRLVSTPYKIKCVGVGWARGRAVVRRLQLHHRLAFEHLRPALPLCCLVSGKGAA